MSATDDALGHFLRTQEIALVVDVGANRGQYAQGLRRDGYRGRIVSFEPLQAAFDALALAAADDPDWTVVRAAVSDRRGHATIFRTENEVSSSLAPVRDEARSLTPRLHAAGEEAVPRVVLADALKQAGAADAKTLLKLDTQGHEATILSSGMRHLRHVHALQIEASVHPLYVNESPAHDLLRFLVAQGFAVHEVLPGFRDGAELLQFDLLAVKSREPASNIEVAESLARLAGREFTSYSYKRITARRLEHLASLQLPLNNRSVLEVGAGVGDLTGFFLDRGCSVTTSDARPGLLQVLRTRHRQAQTIRIDANRPPSPTEHYDITYCAGLLYHLDAPEAALDFLAESTTEMLILSTAVTPGDDVAINPVAEDQAVPTQAVSGVGCRPTRGWVAEHLASRFPYVYFPLTQPAHPQFPTDWDNPGDGPFTRAVFVASRTQLDLPTLTTTMPTRHAGNA